MVKKIVRILEILWSSEREYVSSTIGMLLISRWDNMDLAQIDSILWNQDHNPERKCISSARHISLPRVEGVWTES